MADMHLQPKKKKKRAQGFPPANDFSGFYYPQGIPNRNPPKEPFRPMPHYHQ